MLLSRSFRLLLCLGTLLGPAGDAHGDDGEQLLDEGARLFARAEFKASLRVLTRARAVADEPLVLGRIHLYIGLNHAVLGEIDKARSSLATALHHHPLLTLPRGRFRPDLIALFEAVRAGQQGELVIETEQPGFRVFIDEGEPRAAPLRERLSVGAHRLRIERADGKIILDERLVVRVGRVLRRQVSAPAPRVTVGAATAVRPVSPPPTPPRRRLWTWIAGGAALASGVTAVALGGAAMARHSDNQENLRPICFHGDQRSECQSVLRLDLGANIMYGVTGALAITAVVLFFLEGRVPERPAAASVRLLPTLTGAVFSGEF